MPNEMEELYPSKSHASKEVEQVTKDDGKRVEKVIRGTVKTKKKNDNVKKFTDVFISEDIENVKSYIFMDIFVPAIKKAISDIFSNGIDMLLYGDSGKSRKRTPADRVSYRSYDRAYDRRDYNATRPRTRYSYDEIILDNRGEAQAVLDGMYEVLDMYGMVRVADFYDLVGVTGNPQDNNYGWTSLQSADIIRVRDGFVIKLPRALPIQ